MHVLDRTVTDRHHWIWNEATYLNIWWICIVYQYTKWSVSKSDPHNHIHLCKYADILVSSIDTYIYLLTSLAIYSYIHVICLHLRSQPFCCSSRALLYLWSLACSSSIMVPSKQNPSPRKVFGKLFLPDRWNMDISSHWARSVTDSDFFSDFFCYAFICWFNACHQLQELVRSFQVLTSDFHLKRVVG